MIADLAAFVDSNVLVYAVSDDEPDKQSRAREIVARGFTEGCFAISTQVMMEVYVNVTRKAKIAYTHTPEWEYWDRLKQAPYIGWASSSWQIELQAVPQEQDEDGNWVDLEPYWMQLEELTRDDIIPTEVWDVLLDAVDDKCKVEDSERRRVAAAKATSPAKTSRRRH